MENEIRKTNQDELQALLKQNSALQAKEMAEGGIKADYLILAKTGTKALKRTQKDLYIEGLQVGDIFIQKDKKILGKEIEVVPLAFITLYQEKSSKGADAQFFGMWNKEQALQFPLVQGSYFDRLLPNGHILTTVNWVMVEVIGHPELENAVLTFKSTGSRIWKAWKDDAKNKSASSATLVYTIFEEAYNNDEYDWTDFGFAYSHSLLEDESQTDIAIRCLKKSNALRESYEKATLVANHDVASLTQKPTALLSDKREIADSNDTEAFEF